MPLFSKKSVVIEAVQWTGDNLAEIESFMHPGQNSTHLAHSDKKIVIPTLEGDMTASPNDWVIRGIKGEFYPCKPDVFALTYESYDPRADYERPKGAFSSLCALACYLLMWLFASKNINQVAIFWGVNAAIFLVLAVGERAGVCEKNTK